MKAGWRKCGITPTGKIVFEKLPHEEGRLCLKPKPLAMPEMRTADDVKHGVQGGHRPRHHMVSGEQPIHQPDAGDGHSRGRDGRQGLDQVGQLHHWRPQAGRAPEIVEALSDIRPYWGYSTENKAFLAEYNMMSKVAKSIPSIVCRSPSGALQFAAISGAEVHLPVLLAV